MVAAACSEAEFIELVEAHGLTETARRLGITVRNVAARRRSLEQKHQRRINTPPHQAAKPIQSHPHRIMLSIPDGIVLVGGDAHYWPGPPSTAHRAFVAFVKRLKPRAVIANGDMFDGARISRHPPIGWSHTPTVKDELETVQERLHEIALACPRGSRRRPRRQGPLRLHRPPPRRRRSPPRRPRRHRRHPPRRLRARRQPPPRPARRPRLTAVVESIEPQSPTDAAPRARRRPAVDAGYRRGSATPPAGSRTRATGSMDSITAVSTRQPWSSPLLPSRSSPIPISPAVRRLAIGPVSCVLRGAVYRWDPHRALR